MSDEGKFKKRMQADDLQKIWMNCRWISMPRMIDILEDAKKEFPEVFISQVKPNEGKLWCNPTKATEWFKKWFGEKEG